MSEIISNWLRDRLGIIIQDQKNFVRGTKDGKLLADILANYGVIDQEALKLIESSGDQQTCYKNFDLISKWLENIKLELSFGEVDEIVDGKCSTIMSVLYKMFLQLDERNSLDFAAEKVCKHIQTPKTDRFTVTSVAESGQGHSKCKKSRHKNSIHDSFDIVHWHQDRYEALRSKCKAQREEYIGYVLRTRTRKFSSNIGMPIKKSEPDMLKETENSVASLDLTCQELMEEKNRAAKIEPFVPDPQKATKILKSIKNKQRQWSENKILKTQLHNELLAKFNEKVKTTESLESEQDMCERLLKQSLFEKQMLTKILEVKSQREAMMENRQMIEKAIAKEREEQFVEKLLQKDKKLNEKEFQYYLEKERALLLHRQIVKERIRLARERNHEMCEDIVEKMFKIAMKEVEYKSTFGEDVDSNTKQQLYNQFVVGESFDDYVSPVEQIVGYKEEEDGSEEFIQKEITRQDKLDQNDLQNYLDFEAPWTLTNDADASLMTVGLNILGYIVYRLLATKYPFHTFRDPLHCQDLIAAVCVQGLQEREWLPTLQRLLDQKKILVTETQDALNFCLEAYKKEMKPDDDEEEGVESIKATTRSSKVRRESRPRRSIKSKAGSMGEAFQLESKDIPKFDKTIQTPKFFPTEEPTLSKAAELGKVADEELASGRPLTDFLIIDMFKEYLRVKLQDIKGWVLVNYPDTIEEAALLEEALSGRRVPGLMHETRTCRSIVEVTDLENEPAQRVEDENEMFRKSRLVDNPKNATVEQSYETVLTAFVRMVHASSEAEDNPIVNSDNGEVTWKKLENSEDLSPLDQFYSDQGCNYALYYQAADFNTIKHLARLIIGDYSIPQKSSLELFGDVLKYIGHTNSTRSEDFGSSKVSKKSDRKPRPVQKVVRAQEDDDDNVIEVQDKTKERRRTGASQRSTIIVRIDKFTQVPEVEYEYVDSEEEQAKPGCDGWDYTHFKINDDLQIVLANIWEKIEQVYVEDFCQLFFIRRCIANAVLPFVKNVKEHFNLVFNRPDEIQTYITKFQVIYNEFDDDLRNDDEFKAEIHCRVHELKEKLTDICDKKMAESEAERRSVIKKNWCPTQLVELANCYLDAVQLEINRCVDTLKFADDYYTSVINRLPNSDQPLVKEKLQKLEPDDPSLVKAVNEVLIQDGNLLPNPLLPKIEDWWKKANVLVTKITHVALENLENMMEIFMPTSANSTFSKTRTGAKKEKRSDKEAHHMKIFEPDDEVKKNMGRIFVEWQTLVNGELARLNIRLKLLKNVLTIVVQETMGSLKDAFQTAYDDIKNKYRAEIESIDNVCEVFFGSTEDELKIQPEMIFKDGTFYLDASSLMFPDPEPSPEPVDLRQTEQSEFTFEQLDKMCFTLMRLAPSGIIPTRSLTFLLQDMIGSDDPPLVPKSWARMDSTSLEKLVKNLFGRLEFVLWKDFFICVLNLPFPTEGEILETRQKFMDLDPKFTELVDLNGASSTDLWFEDPENKMKSLFLRMYSTGSDQFNYTAMIMDFCKSEHLPEALGKVLALALGKKVCWDPDAGKIYVEETLEKRKAEEEVKHARIMDVEKIINEELLKNVENLENLADDERLTEFEESPKPLKKKTSSMYDVLSLKQKSLKIKGEGVKQRKSTTSNKMSMIALSTSRSSRVSKKSLKETSSRLQQENAEEATRKSLDEERVAEDRATEVDLTTDETEIELPPVTLEVTETPPEYFLRLKEIQEALRCAIPQVLKDRVAFPDCFHDLVAQYFNESRREDFNNQVFAHEFLNDPRFLELIGRTRKFLPLQPEKMLTEVLGSRNGK